MLFCSAASCSPSPRIHFWTKVLQYGIQWPASTRQSFLLERIDKQLSKRASRLRGPFGPMQRLQSAVVLEVQSPDGSLWMLQDEIRPLAKRPHHSKLQIPSSEYHARRSCAKGKPICGHIDSGTSAVKKPCLQEIQSGMTWRATLPGFSALSTKSLALTIFPAALTS